MSSTIDQTRLDVRPLTGWIGAEIHGIDLSAPLSDDDVAAIRAAWLQWKVVFFRDQHLTHRQHIDFARRFGGLTDPQPYDYREEELVSEYPELEKISNKKYNARFGKTTQPRQYSNGAQSPEDGRNRSLVVGGWHADWTPAVNPPIATILRGSVIPPYGGDTQWTNVAAAYAGLSDSIKELVNGLWAEHRYGQTYVPLSPDEPFAQWLKEKPLAALHPVVRVHPETGERVLYVNPSFTRQITFLSPRESTAILNLLFEELSRPEYTVRFKWQPGDIAFWDNRSALHLIPSDYAHLGFDRELFRTTLHGEVPVAVDGRESIALEGAPFPTI